MILLIDGYNVIKQALGKQEISEFEREDFIKMLGKYAKIRGHKIRLVFDGGPSYSAIKESRYDINIVYSGAKESADDYIKRYMDKNKSLDVLLVSTDREICRYAFRLRIEQIDSKDFYDIFIKTIESGKYLENGNFIGKNKNSKVVKLSETENPDLDLLMEQSSIVVPNKIEDMRQEGDLFGAIKSNKLKKSEIRKFKKVGKL